MTKNQLSKKCKITFRKPVISQSIAKLFFVDEVQISWV